MQQMMDIQLSDKDFNEIRALFPEGAADKLSREALAKYIAGFWRFVHECIRDFGDVVVINKRDNKRVGVIASTFMAGEEEDLATLAIRVFKRACELLHDQFQKKNHHEVIVAVQSGDKKHMKTCFEWMKPFGISLA